MTSIILHTRRPNCQEKARYALGFYVSADFFFRILSSWKARFSSRSISPQVLFTNVFQVIGISNRLKNDINSKISFSWGRNFNYANWKYLYSYTN